MLRCCKFSCVCALILMFGAPLGAVEKPFWKRKAKAYQRIQNHEILVSVRSLPEGDEGTQKMIHLSGGGISRVPCQYGFSLAQKYDKLSEVTSYITSSKWDASRNTLALSLAAFGYGTDLNVEVHAKLNHDVRELHYKIMSGPMQGMVGVIDFVEVSAIRCEIGILGEYAFERLKIPKLFLTFGMEVMLKGMAVRLRSYMEEEFQKTKKAQ